MVQLMLLMRLLLGRVGNCEVGGCFGGRDDVRMGDFGIGRRHLGVAFCGLSDVLPIFAGVIFVDDRRRMARMVVAGCFWGFDTSFFSDLRTC